MTYEEYKKDGKKKTNYIKIFINKLFTVIIFTMIIIILSNSNQNFRNFLVNDVLNKTMDFSKVNNMIDKVTDVFKIEENTKNVFKEEEKIEKYKDGLKYYVNDDKKVILKDSGIVTFIGEKEGYNNTIVIQQSNGYYAWYGNVKETVKLYDYIERGNEIGTSDGFYYYVLLDNDKPITNEN